MATVAFAFPFLPPRQRRALKSRWSKQLLAALGVRLHVSGTRPASGLVVANHVSWLDVYAINAAVATAFVSKDDVRAWPLIGWLSAHTETIFLERGSRTAAMRAKERLGAELRRSHCVSVFPEGTTTDGNNLLPFHSALFQSAIDAEVNVAPLALRYIGADGQPSAAAIYIGDTSLWQSLRNVAGANGLSVHLCFLPTLAPTGMDRRQLAHRAHGCISHALHDAAGRDEPLARPGRVPHGVGDGFGVSQHHFGVAALDHHA